MKILTLILDVIFPPRETELALRKHNSSPSILYIPGIYQDCMYLAKYQTPLINAVIVENKYHHNARAVAFLAQLLTIWLEQNQNINATFIPIPLSTERSRERGYNQVTEILKKVSPPVKIAEKILTRKQNTVPQATLKRSERLSNMKNAFTCNQSYCAEIESKTVVIIDDVITTGATLAAARAALAPHLPPDTKLICLALAH